MIQATFTVPASEFTPAFFEQIRAFLRDADMEIRIQVRRKTKRGPKNGSAPMPAQGSDPQPSEEVFVKKYPSQPSPEEAERLVAEMHAAQQSRQNLAPSDFAQAFDGRDILDEKEWVRRAKALNIEEPVEELMAMLTK